MSFAKTRVVTKAFSEPASKLGKRNPGIWGKCRFKRGMKLASGKLTGYWNRVK